MVLSTVAAIPDSAKYMRHVCTIVFLCYCKAAPSSQLFREFDDQVDPRSEDRRRGLPTGLDAALVSRL